MKGFDWEKKLSPKKHTEYTFEEIRQHTQSNSVIIKPINECSSQGVNKISSKQEYENIKKVIKEKDYIAENYLHGSLKSVDFYKEGKNIYIYAVSPEIVNNEMVNHINTKLEPLEIPIRYFHQNVILNDAEYQYLDHISKKLDHIQFNGLIHLEYKITKENIIGFIERGARNGYRRTFAYTFFSQNHISNIYIDKSSFKQTIYPTIYTYCYPKEFSYLGLIFTHQDKDQQKEKHIQSIIKTYGDIYSCEFLYSQKGPKHFKINCIISTTLQEEKIKNLYNNINKFICSQ